MQHLVFVVAGPAVQRYVDSESLMPNHCSRWGECEPVSVHQNELDVEDVAVLVLRGWLRMPRIPGLVFHPEGFVIGIPINDSVSPQRP